jgi:UDP-N-acetylmuramyl pentapeptide synthase
MLYLREMLPQNLLGEHFSSAVELSKYLITRLRSDDIVLIKGSRRDSDFGDINHQLKALRLEHLSEVAVSSVNQRFN